MSLSANLADLKVGDEHPVRVMGVINISPESFFKGSVPETVDELRRKTEQIESEGADILDIGARGTAPYLENNISLEEETDRLYSAISAVSQSTDLPISVDTQYAKAAEAALSAGASILNDVSGLQNDRDMREITPKFKGFILMANSSFCDASKGPLESTNEAFKKILARCDEYGIDSQNVVLDPGIGFFRNAEIPWDVWDCTILKNIEKFREFSCPLLIGASRKSFIGKILHQQDPSQRLFGSLAVAAISVNNGAHIIRTHDVAATCEVVRMAEALKPESWN